MSEKELQEWMKEEQTVLGKSGYGMRTSELPLISCLLWEISLQNAGVPEWKKILLPNSTFLLLTKVSIANSFQPDEFPLNYVYIGEFWSPNGLCTTYVHMIIFTLIPYTAQGDYCVYQPISNL